MSFKENNQITHLVKNETDIKQPDVQTSTFKPFSTTIRGRQDTTSIWRAPQSHRATFTLSQAL